jgi:hypothetical protein
VSRRRGLFVGGRGLVRSLAVAVLFVGGRGLVRSLAVAVLFVGGRGGAAASSLRACAARQPAFRHVEGVKQR